ncbi:membrane peptidoglycan carboxypeptidase [Amycolatopsis bartoniae]|uniref:transglycosylase domain-containing protein n=1 Tax=Amycolatopsis bartoniae TaxID=941986 RepID=UPI001197ED60|nr:transglycosylase domain-containing protein [Amycolatopsis bartoniae]MBB2938152.1 membrane peptidoglycan carboxypeptidase [Amycolatopsis bartoniae]TVT03243.1 penicillin-binding protein [Amycolatopsis bartoniae]
MDYGGGYRQGPARIPVRRQDQERGRRHETVWRRVRRTLYVLLGLGMFVPVAAFVVGYFMVDVPDPNALAASLNQPVTLYYADGSTLYTKSSADAHAVVTWDQIPQAMKNAQIAAEDETFMTNSGFDIKAILRTVYNRLTGGTGGGSTIGQEYVKKATGNDEATLSRKFVEMVESYKMTRTYSKQDILTAYLNTVYFGRGAYGISAAAKAYYNEDVSKLTVEQSALLAGLVQLPGQADNPAYQQRRYSYVMGRLLDNHWITQAEFASAQFPTPVATAAKNGGSNLGDRQYIVSEAYAELAQAGYSEQSLTASGAKIYLTIQPDAQQKAEQSVSKIMAADTEYPDEGSALVSANPQTGEILAYYGGDGSTSYDLATTPQQPGSSFKPYVLAAGVREQPDKIGLDTVYDGSDNQTIAGQVVHNSDGEGAPQITVKDAMTKSVNTVFYRMGADVGVSAVRKAAWDAGIPKQITTSLGAQFDSLQNDDPQTGKGTGTTELGISIGQYPVRPIDQAQGYATFAANGMYVPLHMVARVTDDSGNPIYGFTTAPKQAFSQDAATNSAIASIVTASMTDIASSSGDGLSGSRPNASKTGTAQFKDTGHNSEAWMVGYTPQVVTAVWFGNKKQPAPIYGNYHNGKGKEHGYDVYGREEPGYIWQAYMDAYLNGKPVMSFPQAPDLTTPTTTAEPPSSTEPESSTQETSSEPPSPTFTFPTKPGHNTPTFPTCFPGACDADPTRTSISHHKPIRE